MASNIPATQNAERLGDAVVCVVLEGCGGAAGWKWSCVWKVLSEGLW